MKSVPDEILHHVHFDLLFFFWMVLNPRYGLILFTAFTGKQLKNYANSEMNIFKNVNNQ